MDYPSVRRVLEQGETARISSAGKGVMGGGDHGTTECNQIPISKLISGLLAQVFFD